MGIEIISFREATKNPPFATLTLTNPSEQNKNKNENKNKNKNKNKKEKERKSKIKRENPKNRFLLCPSLTYPSN